ncbi:MAG: septum formation initiator family protein [Puniceicoccales bacterium]|jgi:cell division protein FtsB|nr:septum formation initiator family protein [Puniceicoccales bacterium]
MGFNLFRMTKERRYRIFLWLASFLFLSVSVTSGIIVYQSHCQCKAMKAQELHQWKRYQQIKDELETQREHLRELIENPDFLEHVAREHLQMAGENEILFRFE